MNDWKMKIMRIRHTRIIKDPFPEHTDYSLNKKSLSLIDKIFGLSFFIEAPEEINIWKAYMMGYEKAYQEILDNE